MGKPAANSGFGVFRDPGTAQRKLTLLDSSRSGFAASAGSSTVAPGGTLAVTYSGAKTGTNEYVSAMICNGGGQALYYASLTSEGSGTWNMTIPADIAGGSYTLKVFSEQRNGDYKTDYASAFVSIPLTVGEAEIPGGYPPIRFEDVAVPSDTFTFRVVWKGGSEKSIDFTLYKLGGAVYHHGFDKKIVSASEWQYNAWFSDAVACYVIEEPVPGYRTRYENVGVYAGITDRCCDGGTIINYKLPRTGDDANLTLWFGCVLGGLTALALTVSAGKRKKANSK